MQIKADFKELIVEYGAREIRFPYYRYQYELNARGVTDDTPAKEAQDAAVAAARAVCTGATDLDNSELYAVILGVVEEVGKLGNAREPSPIS